MKKRGRPKKITTVAVSGTGTGTSTGTGRKRGRPRKSDVESASKKAKTEEKRQAKMEMKGDDGDEEGTLKTESAWDSSPGQSFRSADDGAGADDFVSEGLHMNTLQVRALGDLVACKECGEKVILGVRPTTKGMISEFTVQCIVCGSTKSTNTPNLVRERKRKREKKGIVLQKNENGNYAHVAAFLDNGLGYSGLKHYCKYYNARCLNEATFVVYAKQVILDVVQETEEFLQSTARIVRKAFETQLESDYIVDLTVSYATTYHQWGSDFCLVAGAVIELQTGLVLDYDVANMYCHVCKINAKRIVNMSPAEMTEWFNKHQDSCEIREWCDEIDQDTDEGVKEIDPKYLEAFIAKKLWSRSIPKLGFRYTTLIHESDERIHAELLKAAPYGDFPVLIDSFTNCFSRRKSEHARTAFQNKLKSKCPRERVQTKDRIMYVYAMSIPEYNRFAIGSNIKLRELVRKMEAEDVTTQAITLQVAEILPVMVSHEDRMSTSRTISKKIVQEAELDEDEGDSDEEEDAEVLEVSSPEKASPESKDTKNLEPDIHSDHGNTREEMHNSDRNKMQLSDATFSKDKSRKSSALEVKNADTKVQGSHNGKTTEQSTTCDGKKVLPVPKESSSDKEALSESNLPKHPKSVAGAAQVMPSNVSSENGADVSQKTGKKTDVEPPKKPFRVDFDED